MTLGCFCLLALSMLSTPAYLKIHPICAPRSPSIDLPQPPSLVKTASLFFALLLASVSLGRAATYFDNNPADVLLSGFVTSYTGTFDIAGAGYDPAIETISSAQASFELWDLLLSESLTIKFGPDTFASSGSFSGFITLSGNVVGAAFGTLDSTGILSYTVHRNSGSFWLTNARLDVETTSRNVPDAGSSIALLGFAITGLALVRRRSAK